MGSQLPFTRHSSRGCRVISPVSTIPGDEVVTIREMRCLALLLATWGCVPAAHAAFAGLWFQCQPRWQSEKNYLLVEVKRDERNWEGRWGVGDSARGPAQTDAEGNLKLRGCHSIGGKPSASCNPENPPEFAMLPKALATAAPAAAAVNEVALRRGAWLRTSKASLSKLAAECAAVRPKPKG
jgi:hypothetical protein